LAGAVWTVPAGQEFTSTHRPEFSSVEWVPAGHGAHARSFSMPGVALTYSPAWQVVQGVHSLASGASLKLPLGHPAQPRGLLESPSSAAYWPGMQRMNSVQLAALVVSL
jgi:hypothetical protein